MTRNAHHSTNDELTAGDMRDNAKVLVDLINPKSNLYRFCFPLRFSFSYKALVSLFTGKHTIDVIDQKDPVSEIEENETLEKPLVIDIETAATNYTLTIGNYEEKAAAKLAMHTSIVETAIDFSQ